MERVFTEMTNLAQGPNEEPALFPMAKGACDRSVGTLPFYGVLGMPLV